MSISGLNNIRDRIASEELLGDLGYSSTGGATFTLTGLSSNALYELTIYSRDWDSNAGVETQWYEGSTSGALLATSVNATYTAVGADFTVELFSDAAGKIIFASSGLSVAKSFFNGMIVVEHPNSPSGTMIFVK